MRILVFLLIICWLGSCRHKISDALPVVDFEQAEQGDTLKMSEILDHLSIISFETHPEALLPDYFNVWVGDRYLAFTKEKVLMFSSEGKYLRKLIEQERGPEEFFIVLGYYVDEKEDLLYLADGDRKIDVVDIQKEKMLQKIDVVCSISPMHVI